ncbi:AraC family transcriptional regulator [Microbulbifer variabilis]|uniref:AraC family transcriptional regulator n=1 Tax=Microbulbifer variabilis TaxID=266805 RepID=UPI00036D1229|nr:AraC family transcriptional regulator [Microbulbifer variabilis]
MDLTDTRSVNLNYTRALFEALTSLGLAIPEGASNLLSQINQEERIPIYLQDLLWESVIESYHDPLLGVRLGLAMQASQIGLVGYLLMTQKNLGEAIEQLITYHPLLGEGGHFEMRRDAFAVNLCYHPSFLSFAKIRVETVLTACIAQTRILTGGKFQPLKLFLSYPAPSLALQQCYQELLQLPLEFNAKVSAIQFTAKDLALPLIAADEEVVACLKPKADVLLQTFAAKTLHRKVTLLLQQAPGLTREKVAKHLCLSPRHLGRKLQEEQISFRALQDEVRSHYAKQWLKEGEKTIVEIASTLGYSDESAFGKAFRRWESISPGSYRQSLKHKTI